MSLFLLFQLLSFRCTWLPDSRGHGWDGEWRKDRPQNGLFVRARGLQDVQWVIAHGHLSERTVIILFINRFLFLILLVEPPWVRLVLSHSSSSSGSGPESLNWTLLRALLCLGCRGSTLEACWSCSNSTYHSYCQMRFEPGLADKRHAFHMDMIWICPS